MKLCWSLQLWDIDQFCLRVPVEWLVVSLSIYHTGDCVVLTSYWRFVMLIYLTGDYSVTTSHWRCVVLMDHTGGVVHCCLYPGRSRHPPHGWLCCHPAVRLPILASRCEDQAAWLDRRLSADHGQIWTSICCSQTGQRSEYKAWSRFCFLSVFSNCHVH